jgi:peptidoglycan/xylan/chitin deacetylase (PgdA/CDA1 family)
LEPAIVRRVKAEGHCQVNHFYYHHGLISGDTDTILKEITDCDLAIGRALGENNYHFRLIRPPSGLVTSRVHGIPKQVLEGQASPGRTSKSWKDKQVLEGQASPGRTREKTEDIIREIEQKECGIIIICDGKMYDWPIFLNEFCSPS